MFYPAIQSLGKEEEIIIPSTKLCSFLPNDFHEIIMSSIKLEEKDIIILSTTLEEEDIVIPSTKLNIFHSVSFLATYISSTSHSIFL